SRGRRCSKPQRPSAWRRRRCSSNPNRHFAVRLPCFRFNASKAATTMAPNFFQQQDSARRKTFQLVVYFVLAILILIALVYGLLLALGESVSWWQPELLLLAGLGVGFVVGGASAFKVAQLASGGQAVALMMGGEEVPGTTTDARHKRLLNVVEEMALAAGVPVPPVYVLKEPGINAFAAGYSPGDAVVAVSQGCLDYLSRDELQGVVAHEFSHILNGDMRLNIRLIGLIFGIMALSIIGRILMFASRGRSSGRSDSRGGLVLLGLGVFVLGLVGAFFGRLIMAAVSRQREYLADASAVQFTRNPDGIGGALKKIGGLAEGSRIDNPQAAKAGHMFFANAFAGSIPSSTASSRRCGRSASVGKNSKVPARAAFRRSPGCRGYRGCRRCRRRSCGSPTKRRPGSAMSIPKKSVTPERCTTASPTCSASPPRSRSVRAPWSTPFCWTRGRTCATCS